MTATGRIDPEHYASVTFDCYGTLIDWETGILEYLQPLLRRHYINTIDEFVLGYFAEIEPLAQDEGGSYAEVLRRVMAQFARRLAFTPDEEALTGLARSISGWRPFPDAVEALHGLQEHFKLGILSNIDDDMFAASQAHLQTTFDYVITAQRVGCYKPAPQMFDTLLAEVPGPILHVAQSRFHDILPAATAGIDTVWLNRPSKGAALPVAAEPKWTFTSMAELVAAIAPETAATAIATK